MRGDVSAAIDLGGKIYLMTDNIGQLMITHNYAHDLNVTIKLGRCTKRRIEELQEHLEHLKIHAVEEL